MNRKDFANKNTFPHLGSCEDCRTSSVDLNDYLRCKSCQEEENAREETLPKQLRPILTSSYSLKADQLSN